MENIVLNRGKKKKKYLGNCARTLLAYLGRSGRTANHELPIYLGKFPNCEIKICNPMGTKRILIHQKKILDGEFTVIWDVMEL